MKKIVCILTGHSWLYGDHKGVQNQPTKRACRNCFKVETFHGQMSSWPGTFNQLWYDRKDWYSYKRWLKLLKKQKYMQDKFDDLTK